MYAIHEALAPMGSTALSVRRLITKSPARLGGLAALPAKIRLGQRMYSLVARHKGRYRSPSLPPSPTDAARRAETKPKERIVILGSGWAGYAFARTLDPAKFERIVVSPRSHFVFTPLLAGTAVGTIEFRAVLEPVRRLGPVTFHQGWADDVDFARKVVRVEPVVNPDAAELAGHGLVPPPPAAATPPQLLDVPYDKLVVAVGAYSQTFGVPGVRAHAHFLRDVADARRIRLRVLSLFEACASPALDDEARRRLLRFAVVGGGPTGIEFAAELHDLIRDDLARLYPTLAPLASIAVYDIAPAVLPMFDRQLAAYAADTFRRQGIEVHTGHHLEAIRDDPASPAAGLRLRFREHGDDEVAVGMVVWSTGLMQNPLVEKLVRREFRMPGALDGAGSLAHLAKDPKTGGVVTDSQLRARIAPVQAPGDTAVPGEASTGAVLPDVFVLGDCSVVETDAALPKTAQVASQQAAYLAKALNRDALGAAPFRFRNWGTMAYLGSWRAIHQSSADEIKGRAAWVLWRTAYLTYSMSVRNKIMVPVYWLVSWLFGRDISRF